MSNPYKGSLSKGTTSELVDEGQHIAVIVAMIDLGTHLENGFNGGPEREVRKCFFAFELVNEKMDNGLPFVVGREYTTSLNSKSAMVQMLQKVRGKEYGDSEQVDVTGCVGKGCQVLIQHRESSSGRKYAKIADVTAPPKGARVGKSTHTPIVFVIDDDDANLELPDQDWLPFSIGERLSEKIARSPEWKKYTGQDNATATKKPLNGIATNGHPSNHDDAEMEVPF